jgi:hypothetical protein
LDLCDVHQNFGIELLQDAKTFTPLKYAVLALAARQQELPQSTGVQDFEANASTAAYKLAQRLTWSSSQNENNCGVYTYSMLKIVDIVSAAPRAWRQHVQDSIPFLGSLCLQAFSGGLMATMFWSFARLGKHSSCPLYDPLT